MTAHGESWENDTVRPRINNLHAIRIVAAVLVVYYHSGYRLWGLRSFGGFSVPLFFIISGFVLALVAEEQPQQFLRRRLLRAVPTYWFGTITIFLISARFPLLFHSTRPRLLWLMKSLLFIPFEKAPGIIEPLMFVGWTMNCEVLLYLLIALGLRVMPQRPVVFSAAALLLFMTVCSTMANVSAVAFFYSRSSMLCFVLGLLAYPLWKRMEERHALAMRGYAWGILIAVFAALCVLEGTEVAPYLTADGMFALRPLIPEIGSLLIVGSALVLAKAGLDVRSKEVLLLADSTFVLYLTHAYLLLGFARVSASFAPSLAVTRPLGFLLMLSLAMSCALVVHVTLEKPAMAMLKRIFLRPPGAGKPAILPVVQSATTLTT